MGNGDLSLLQRKGCLAKAKTGARLRNVLESVTAACCVWVLTGWGGGFTASARIPPHHHSPTEPRKEIMLAELVSHSYSLSML